MHSAGIPHYEGVEAGGVSQKQNSIFDI